MTDVLVGLTTPRPGSPSATDRKWWTLGVVCVAVFMLLLDITIVNVALPRISADLRASFSDIQWVIDAYALGLASLLLTAGALADHLGRRLLFSIGLGLFSLTSLLCALSPSTLFLILARAGQGIGGAIMFSTSLALLAQEFQGRERATAFAAWGATIGLSAAIGPLLGGALTEVFGWSSIFYVNVPIGLSCLALTLTKVGETRDGQKRRIDWIGTASFSAALFMLVLALTRANANGWGSALIVSLLGGATTLLVVFLVSQCAQRHPMLDLSLFRKAAFGGASLAAIALSGSMFAMFLYLSLYMQTLLGLSPLQTGLRYLPHTVAMFLVAAASGKLARRFPARALLGAGLALVGVGLLLMRGLSAGSQWTALLAGLIVAGVGVGLANPAIAATAIGVVSPERSGMASGINSTFRQVGIATGIAALGAIFGSQLSSSLGPRLATTPLAGHAGQIAHAVLAGGPQKIFGTIPGGLSPHVADAIQTAFASAMNLILLIAGIVALAGASLAALLVRDGDFAAQRPLKPVAGPADVGS